VRRREFITLLGGAAAWPLTARSQQQPKMARVGFLSPGSGPNLKRFVDGLNELGWIEGQNLAMEYRFAGDRMDALAALADELVRLKVDVIATAATPSAKAAQKATSTIPIVIIDPGDPIETGLVATLARPGGNIAGQTSMAPDLVSKRLQLLKETAPSIERVGIMWNSAIPPAEVALKELGAAAVALKVEILSVPVSGNNEFETAFETITRERADGLLVFHDPLIGNNAQVIVDAAGRNRIPALFWYDRYVRLGGLMSYGPSYADMFHRAGNYAGRILMGTKPAELPVVQPDTFYFVINIKTAKALGLTVSNQLQLLADEIIE
jgi:putative ABC transport system substrate-binding protein